MAQKKTPADAHAQRVLKTIEKNVFGKNLRQVDRIEAEWYLMFLYPKGAGPRDCVQIETGGAGSTTIFWSTHGHLREKGEVPFSEATKKAFAAKLKGIAGKMARSWASKAAA